MKILIVSNSPWRNDNSFGNSFSNIFQGMDDLVIANVYLKYGIPDNNVVSEYYQITEKYLLNNLINRKNKSGRVLKTFQKEENDELGNKQFNKAKKYKSVWLFWIRALIWKIGRWKSKEFVNFIDEFNPDLLFIPVYYSHYIHDINLFIKERLNIPAVGYVSDDVYIRPCYGHIFQWIDRSLIRPIIRKVFNACDIVYTISEIQRNEYSSLFGNKFKILTKFAEFEEEREIPVDQHKFPIKMLYTGNISTGRFQSIGLIVQAIKEINKSGKKIIFDIYTTTVLTAKQVNEISVENTVRVHGAVPYDEIIKLQEQADLLVHIEGLSKKENSLVRQSFSTKIVDYLEKGRAIFVVGREDSASVKYFIDNDSAFVAQGYQDIFMNLNKILDDMSLLKVYAQKAWKCGKKNHQKSVKQVELKNDLLKIVNHSK